MKINLPAFAVATAVSLTSLQAQARDLTLTITNLTQGQSFTPRLVVVHDNSTNLFTAGQAASAELEALAEQGDTAPFTTFLGGGNTATDEPNVRTFGGLVNPASSRAYSTFTVSDNLTHLSLLSMLVPTNDAFVGLDAWEIPTTPGTYTININAYDAGTEANDEIAANMPNPATDPNVGTNATGVTTTVEGAVHIHRNVLGDTDNAAGSSDLDSTVHRWLNPVARLTVVVSN